MMTLLEICETLLDNKDVIADNARSGEDFVEVGESDLLVDLQYGLCCITGYRRDELECVFVRMGLDSTFPVEDDGDINYDSASIEEMWDYKNHKYAQNRWELIQKVHDYLLEVGNV